MRLIFFILLFVAAQAYAEGTLTLEPTHDFVQGEGGIFTFDGDAHLYKRWYLDPYAQLSTVERYRDLNCSLDFEYKWTERFSTTLGAGYDSYRHYGDERVQSNDVHTKVKIKLWN